MEDTLNSFKMSDFKSWLLTKDFSEIVGERRDSCKCPVANWLNSTNSLDRKVSVYYRWIYISSTWSVPTNPWINKFIEFTNVPSSYYCTVEEALFILTKIENNIFL